MIRYSEPVYVWIEKVLPGSWVRFLNRYSSDTQQIQAISGWKQLLRTYARVIVVNGVICIGVVMLCASLLAPFLNRQFHDVNTSSVVLVILILLVLSPFLWALGFRRADRISFAKLWLDSKFNRGPLVMMEVLRMAVVVAIIGFVLDKFFSASIAIPIAILLVILLILLFSKKLQAFYGRIEARFLFNLNEKELKEKSEHKGSVNLVPWDGHVVYFDIPPDASFAGQTLKELGWREKYGVNVATIERGSRLIQVPGAENRIFPSDHISVIGTDEQLQQFSELIRQSEAAAPPGEDDQVELVQVVVGKNSPLLGRSIRESGVRSQGKGLVVGVERHGERLLNPDSVFVLQEGDRVWIAGSKNAILAYA